MDLPDSGFAVLWILFVSGCSMWIYQRVDLLYCEYCLYLDVVQIFQKANLPYFGYCPYLGVDSIFVQIL